MGVHIADVSYYVKPGTPVDAEAQARGTSVYLVDRTVPMLPEKLSNKLCSLRPHEEKLTFSAVFEITPLAKVINPWFGRTEIVSDYRFSYELAQAIIDAGDHAMVEQFGEGSECGIVPDEVKEAVLTLNKLALKLRKKRFAAGAVSFDRPEMKVDIDENGKPVGVHQKFSKEANWLIEEFMLLANKNVAEFVASGGKMGGKALSNAKTFVYRVHDEPNLEKVTGLREFAGNLGYKMGPIGSGKDIALSLNSLLADAKEKPELGAIQILALRAMAKACYSTDNIGHYGLAFKFYTHFTSPIRRYPDLMVHSTACWRCTSAGPIPSRSTITPPSASTLPNGRWWPRRPSARASSTSSWSSWRTRWARSSTATCPASPSGASTWRSSPPRSRA